MYKRHSKPTTFHIPFNEIVAKWEPTEELLTSLTLAFFMAAMILALLFLFSMSVTQPL